MAKKSCDKNHNKELRNNKRMVLFFNYAAVNMAQDFFVKMLCDWCTHIVYR